MFLFLIKLLLLGTLMAGVALYITMLALSLLTFWIKAEDIRMKIQQYAVRICTIVVCGFVGSYQANLAYDQDTMTAYWIVVGVSAIVYYLVYQGIDYMWVRLLAYAYVNEEPLSRLDASALKVQSFLFYAILTFHPATFAVCLLFPLQSNNLYFGLPRQVIELF